LAKPTLLIHQSLWRARYSNETRQRLALVAGNLADVIPLFGRRSFSLIGAWLRETSAGELRSLSGAQGLIDA
jgi:hypothetical protein